MPYIGNSPGTGTRNRFIYTATASQTTFSGADDNGKTLKYADSDYVDVYLNGICLVPSTDYTSTSKTSIVLTQAASLNDTLEVVAYDIATISDTVSKADGGTFEGDLGITNSSPDITLTNNTTEDTDGGRESTVTFKGLQSGGEESTLAQIQASHDATSDDQKGDLIFKTNDGSDGSSPTERMRIDSAGAVTFTSDDTSDQFVIQNNDAGSGSAPDIVLYRNSASPADGDTIGRVDYRGEDDGGTARDYVTLYSKISDASTGTPAGSFHIQTRNGTNQTDRLVVDGSGNLGLTPDASNTMYVDRGALNVNHKQDSSGGEFTNPHIACTFGQSPVNNDSVCMISYATSDSDNYGYTVGSKRSSAGNGSFLINHHLNNATGTTRFSINGSGSLNVMGVYNDTTTSSANVNVASDGHIRRVVSSRRYKNTINDATHGLAELLTLRPVTYKGNNEDFVVGGLIAEEVHDAGLTEFVEYDDDGEPDALAYSNMVSLCIKAIQEQQATITAQAAKIETLETEMTSVKSRLDALEAE